MPTLPRRVPTGLRVGVHPKSNLVWNKTVSIPAVFFLPGIAFENFRLFEPFAVCF